MFKTDPTTWDNWWPLPRNAERKTIGQVSWDCGEMTTSRKISSRFHHMNAKSKGTLSAWLSSSSTNSVPPRRFVGPTDGSVGNRTHVYYTL